MGRRQDGEVWIPCEAGIVYVKKAPWNEVFLDEVCNFPRATHDDQVIAGAGAFNRTATVR